jgi:hypothetical protein
MATTIDPDIDRDIDGVLASAHEMLASVQWAYDHYGTVPDHMLSGVEALQDDMIRLLALCEDGELYGKVRGHLIMTMREFESEACDILATYEKMAS